MRFLKNMYRQWPVVMRRMMPDFPISVSMLAAKLPSSTNARRSRSM